MSTPSPTPAGTPSTGDPLADHLRQHADRARSGLAALEQEAEVEVVHDTRTSLRRVRATMRTFAGSFAAAETVDEDLRFVAVALGAVRDADVLAEALLPDLEAMPEELVPGPARGDLHDALAARRRDALESVGRARMAPPWNRAVAQLTAWRDAPPVLAPQDHARTLMKARRRVRRRIQNSGGDPFSLHSARKASKRWRYAAELLVEVEPVAGMHLERAMEVQRVLGQVQDAVVALEFLREHADLGARSGHNAFSTGLLFARAQQRLESSPQQ
ncbi:MAG: CHAD domain-containing protein, partial [Brachybacterium sp.]|nr:CHAD domain-containing protein [Brachybacterium sp.]